MKVFKFQFIELLEMECVAPLGRQRRTAPQWLLPGRSCQRARNETLTDVECGRKRNDTGVV